MSLNTSWDKPRIQPVKQKLPKGFEELPIQTRMAVQKVIQRRVAERVHEEMEGFKLEVSERLEKIKPEIEREHYNAYYGYGQHSPYSQAHGYPGYAQPPSNAYFGGQY